MLVKAFSVELDKKWISVGAVRYSGAQTSLILYDYTYRGKRLRDEQDSERFAAWSRLLFEQAMLTQGGQLDDPTAFVKRLNGILVELSQD